ncbi:MAG: dimethylsulfonioproprionate lyase family protein [Chthoniobacteraceae bacterium]|nr:dimethylsulfonioproprionate lyase family protein [Chthoniobacteraceae bacterium]
MASIPFSAWLSLIGLMEAHFRRGLAGRDAVSEEIARVLALLEPLPPLSGPFPRNRQPATRHLEAAFQAGSAATADLLATIRPVASHLPWRYSYTKRKDAPGIGRNIAFAELVGPKAPFQSDRVCLGLTLIGPGTLYPAHAHPAVELYYVVAGMAEWTAGENAQRPAPGAFVLHPSQVVHSMRTDAEPLLAVYSWSGDDVKTLSAYTSPNPSPFHE